MAKCNRKDTHMSPNKRCHLNADETTGRQDIVEGLMHPVSKNIFSKSSVKSCQNYSDNQFLGNIGLPEFNRTGQTITLWACGECKNQLEPGIAFYMFECFRHTVCKRCLCSKLDVLKRNSCYICDLEQLEELENKKPQYEDKNSLPLVKISGGSSVGAGPDNLKYEYPSHIRNTRISGITDEYVQIPTRRNISLSSSIFNTAYKDTIIACGLDSPTLTVISPDGLRATHTLTEGDRIMSGMFVQKDVYLICTEHIMGYVYLPLYISAPIFDFKLHVIRLDALCPIPTTIAPLSFSSLSTDAELLTCYLPQLFYISKQKYGLLSSRNIKTTNGDTYDINVINIYPLDSLVLHNDTHKHSIQSHLLWGKRIVRLEGSNGTADSICVTTAGYFCLAQNPGHDVRIYSPTGMYQLCIEGYGFSGEIIHGALACIKGVLSTENGGLMVVGQYGDVLVFTPHTRKWKKCNALTSRNMKKVDITDCVGNDDYIDQTGSTESLTSTDSDEACDEMYGHWSVLRDARYNREIIYSALSESRLWFVVGFNRVIKYNNIYVGTEEHIDSDKEHGNP